MLRFAALPLLVPLAAACTMMTGLDTSPEEGRRAFVEDCAACHGAGATGDGPMAASLVRPPPDLTGIAARNGGVFPRDEVMSTIDGYLRGDRFSPAMPEFGAGDMGPTVIVERDGIGTPVPARLLALANYLETIQRTP